MLKSVVVASHLAGAPRFAKRPNASVLP